MEEDKSVDEENQDKETSATIPDDEKNHFDNQSSFARYGDFIEFAATTGLD